MTNRHFTERRNDRLKPRPSRETLARALAGMWVVGLATVTNYIVATQVNAGLGVALMVLVFPIFIAVVVPFCQDAWRNPSLSRASAFLWVWTFTYLGPIAESAYWFSHLSAEREVDSADSR